VFVRGAVSGVGALTTLAGLAELAGLFVAKGEKDVDHLSHHQR
jgi:hypothetical protein